MVILSSTCHSFGSLLSSCEYSKLSHHGTCLSWIGSWCGLSCPSVSLFLMTALTVAGDVFFVYVMTCLTFNITVEKKKKRREKISFSDSWIYIFIMDWEVGMRFYWSRSRGFRRSWGLVRNSWFSLMLWLKLPWGWIDEGMKAARYFTLVLEAHQFIHTASPLVDQLTI